MIHFFILVVSSQLIFLNCTNTFICSSTFAHTGLFKNSFLLDFHKTSKSRLTHGLIFLFISKGGVYVRYWGDGGSTGNRDSYHLIEPNLRENGENLDRLEILWNLIWSHTSYNARDPMRSKSTRGYVDVLKYKSNCWQCTLVPGRCKGLVFLAP